MKGFLAKKSLTTVMDRLQGRPASRASALLLSAVAGVASAVAAYRLLRSGGDEADDDEVEDKADEEPEEEAEST